MQLSNFSLTTDAAAYGYLITLNAHGFEWDLHNHADFEGFDYLTTTTSSTLRLNWRIAERIIQWRDAGNQYEVPSYPGNRFCVVFTDVGYLEVAPRDAEMPKDEDLGTSWVSFMGAGDDLKDHVRSGSIPCYVPNDEAQPRHLVFRFNGGQIIRVGAENAEFILMAGVH